MKTTKMPFDVTMREDGAVVVVKLLDKTRATVYTAAYLASGPMSFFMNESAQPRFRSNDWGTGWNLAITLALTAVWLYFMAGLRIVTWFEPGAEVIRRRNLLFYSSVIPCERIAEIGIVNSSGAFTGEVYFRLIDKRNPLGKGYELTRRMDPDGLEFPYFIENVVPALNTILFGAAEGPGPDAEEIAAEEGVPPERLACYRRSRSVFTRRQSLRALLAYAGAAFFFLAGLVMCIYGVMEEFDSLVGTGITAFVIGLVVLLYATACAGGFSIDIATGEILIARWFGRLVRRIPLGVSVQLTTERSYGNFMYLGTRLLLRYPTKLMVREYVLGSGHFSTKGLSRVERETRLLMTAARANRLKAQPGEMQ